MKTEKEIRNMLIKKRKQYVKLSNKQREPTSQFVKSIWVDALEWVLNPDEVRT